MTAKKGFTLIELLVVIAIIGILSAVVLTSLNAARVKARDARVKAEMSSLRAQMEVYYDNEGGYGTAANDCSAGGFASAQAYITSIGEMASAGPVCHATDDAYAISATLPSAEDSWCVDSAGFADVGTAGADGECAAA